MARTQALDYPEKRLRILDIATELFAKQGFHATSITDIAQACETSKSRLYHYFDSKEQLLYEILRDHALVLRDSLSPIVSDTGLDAPQKLEKYAAHLLFTNITFRAKHKLILGELGALPLEKRQEVSSLLRQSIETIYDILSEINPKLAHNSSMKFPTAMMFIGMINWTHTWFSGEGALSTDVFAKLLCDTFIGGFSNVDLDKHFGA